MAVEDKKLYESTSRIPSVQVDGVEKKTVRQIVAIAVDDSDGSVYRLCKLPANAVIVDVRYYNDAITGGTDYDLGLYEGDGGAVADKDCLDDGFTFAVAQPVSSFPNQGMRAVTLANREKQLYELAADDDVSYPGFYDVALTANTAGSGAGNILVEIDYIIAA